MRGPQLDYWVGGAGWATVAGEGFGFNKGEATEAATDVVVGRGK